MFLDLVWVKKQILKIIMDLGEKESTVLTKILLFLMVLPRIKVQFHLL